MKQLFRYLYERRWLLGSYIFFCAVFAGAFALFGLPVKAVIYPAAVCGTVGAVALICGFAEDSRKHRELSGMIGRQSELIDSLPEPKTAVEADYQEIIRSVQSELRELGENSSKSYRDMIDYYTVWAHQIKTPIASMQLTLQNEDSPTARKLSGDLSRIEQYVGMVLAFLRLDSSANDYVFRETELDQVIRQAVKKFASEFIDRKISLDFEPTGEKTVTDEKWLLFVIEQILSNSLKYTRAGSVRIYMRKPKILCIEDTGIGIAPEDVPRVFEKGYTGYNGRTDKKATGLGLYLCRRICRNLGAQITLASELGRGTLVSIDLGQYRLRAE